MFAKMNKVTFSFQLKLFVENETDLQNAAKDLRAWGCCPRCTLRYLGEEKMEPYKDLEVRCLEKYLFNDNENYVPSMLIHMKILSVRLFCTN